VVAEANESGSIPGSITVDVCAASHLARAAGLEDGRLEFAMGCVEARDDMQLFMKGALVAIANLLKQSKVTMLTFSP
jgi:hypothetical protein